jgi:hypothetical protein
MGSNVLYKLIDQCRICGAAIVWYSDRVPSSRKTDSRKQRFYACSACCADHFAQPENGGYTTCDRFVAWTN